MNLELVIIVAVYCCAELVVLALPDHKLSRVARIAIAIAAVCTIIVYLGHAKTRIDAEERVQREEERARQQRRERDRYIREHMIRHPE